MPGSPFGGRPWHQAGTVIPVPMAPVSGARLVRQPHLWRWPAGGGPGGGPAAKGAAAFWPGVVGGKRAKERARGARGDGGDGGDGGEKRGGQQGRGQGAVRGGGGRGGERQQRRAPVVWAGEDGARAGRRPPVDPPRAH